MSSSSCSGDSFSTAEGEISTPPSVEPSVQSENTQSSIFVYRGTVLVIPKIVSFQRTYDVINIYLGTSSTVTIDFNHVPCDGSRRVEAAQALEKELKMAIEKFYLPTLTSYSWPDHFQF